jgi:hypothetical protein
MQSQEMSFEFALTGWKLAELKAVDRMEIAGESTINLMRFIIPCASVDLTHKVP